MEKKRLTITLDYDVWRILNLQAKVHERSLGKHINALLRDRLCVKDAIIEDAILRLQAESQLTVIASKADLVARLSGQSHFKV